ncbi:polyketide synthase [Streptomyces sp. DSM 44915]|uniref:Polyketide synthase n=1 Tax=Streptomyces chisholmiae TaxID=3075540 RepID=A0ABU2JTN5_9ACTN|nr:polyketide synthase [Streptomyces sp. DSM 44915]MDT0268350.1 polyketide synthase [Streptomyces sp. DSM 44915]
MSQVVTVTEPLPGVAQIVMADREHKNTFTDALLAGLGEAFTRVAADERYKAVVLTGYGTYFCSGGTRDALLGIQEGTFTFQPEGVPSAYSLALDCPIPVISAMQGHAIGGGLSMGLFADFVIFSRESVYTANFMKFGFTPGFGSTRIFPAKLGLALAQEFLLTGRTFRGTELAERGVPFPVRPRDEVLPAALELAGNLAEKPRRSLVVLKDHLVRELREQLPAVIEQELAMHAQTLHQPEVRDLVLNRYGT